MKLFASLIVLLVLAACGGGGGLPPLPTPSPGPPIARPGVQVLPPADWSPPFSVSGTCGGSPFTCTLPPGTQWGLQQGTDVKYLTPAPGQLGVSTGNNGFSLVSSTLLDHTQPMSVREVLRVDSLDCDGSVSYAGPVIYAGGVDDGDPTGRYRAEYISCFPGDKDVKVWLYSPTYAAPMPNTPGVPFGTHTLRIDWYPGTRVDYFLDDETRPLFTEDVTFGHDPLDEPHNPRPAIWFGSFRGAVLEFDGWGQAAP